MEIIMLISHQRYVLLPWEHYITEWTSCCDGNLLLVCLLPNYSLRGFFADKPCLLSAHMTTILENYCLNVFPNVAAEYSVNFNGAVISLIMILLGRRRRVTQRVLRVWSTTASRTNVVTTSFQPPTLLLFGFAVDHTMRPNYESSTGALWGNVSHWVIYSSAAEIISITDSELLILLSVSQYNVNILT